jgi:hypothetical protein
VHQLLDLTEEYLYLPTAFVKFPKGIGRPSELVGDDFNNLFIDLIQNGHPSQFLWIFFQGGSVAQLMISSFKDAGMAVFRELIFFYHGELEFLVEGGSQNRLPCCPNCSAGENHCRTNRPRSHSLSARGCHKSPLLFAFLPSVILTWVRRLPS